MPAMYPFSVVSADGRIVRTGMVSRPEWALEQAVPGSGEIALTIEADPETQFFSDSQLTPRPVLAGLDRLTIAADGVEVATLAGLPDPCPVTVNGQAHSVTGGVLELTADYPGDYRVEVRHFPWRDFTATITATALPTG
jgi:hypothetical protein